MKTLLALATAAFLSACGGGQATDEEIAAADAAVAAVQHQVTTQPVICTAAGSCS